MKRGGRGGGRGAAARRARRRTTGTATKTRRDQLQLAYAQIAEKGNEVLQQELVYVTK